MFMLSVIQKPSKIISTILCLALLFQSVSSLAMTGQPRQDENPEESIVDESTDTYSDISFYGLSYTADSAPVVPQSSGTSSLTLEDYVVFATHSAWLKQGSKILSGSVGVNEAGDPPFLSSASELTVSQSATTPPDYNLKANRIEVKKKALIHSDVYCNDLDNKGKINGQIYQPLSLPLVSSLPDFHTGSPGSQDISIKKYEEEILDPGDYGDVRMKKNGRLILTGGIYNIKSLNGDDDVELIFQAPSEVRVSEKFEIGKAVFIGPQDTSAVGATEIVFYIAGVNGKDGEMGSSPKSAKVGKDNTVWASFYVLNGTLWLNHNTEARGVYIGRDIIVDLDATVTLGAPSIPDNEPPVVDAGVDQNVDFAVPVQLSGSITDDGLPENGQLTAWWSQVSGPYPAFFDDTTQVETIVHFNAPGEYILRLTAHDGELSSSDDVSIIVNQPPDNQPPAVYAGADQSIGLTYATTLEGSAGDDGLPHDNFLTATWSKLSGPGFVGFHDKYDTTTTVTFSQSGTYVLRLTGDDGEYSVFDDVTIKVHIDNIPPIVEAGENQTVTTPEALLQGTVTEDGLPSDATLTLAWTQSSGPGTVNFLSPDMAVTQATFSQAGTYILRLTANDGQFSGHDEITVEVIGNQPPVVDAGDDHTLEIATPFSYDPSALPQQPEAQPDWLYDIGRPGVDWLVSENGIHVIDDKVYVGGIFDQAGGVESGCVAMWDGCGWHQFYDTTPKDPSDPNSPPMGYLYNEYNTRTGITVQDGNIYVAGQTFMDLDRPPNINREFHAFWNGVSWNLMPMYHLSNPGMCQYYHEICAGPDGIYIVGNFRFHPIITETTAWHEEPLPGVPFCDNIARWNGTHWEALGEGLPTQGGGGVSVTVDEAGNVFVGGHFEMDSPTGPSRGVIHWNGTEWNPVCYVSGGATTNNFGTPYPVVNDIEIDDDGNLYIAGNFTAVNGLPVRHLAKGEWDDAGQEWVWSAVGPSNYYGLNAKIWDIALMDSSVYVAGVFLKAHPIQLNYVARWDGTNWQPLGTAPNVGTSGYVKSIVADSTKLYMGGHFSQAGGEPASYIVGWGVDQKKYVDAMDSVYVDNAPQEGIEATVSALVKQRCGDAMTVTWNVDGGAVEETIELPAGTTAELQEVEITYHFTPGTHFVTLTVDDGQCVPIIKNIPVTILAPGAVALNGTATDDGLPVGSTLSVQWTVVSGPGPVVFDDPTQAQTTARFQQVGTYVLHLTGDDSEYTRYDEAVVYVQSAESENRPPSVNAGMDRSIYPSEPLDLFGGATDDGLPSGVLTYQWSQTSGPGLVTFADANALQTTAAFNQGGTYVLRLTADDSELTSIDEMTVYVSTVENQPPTVYAGDDQIVNLSQRTVLNATIQDDGLLYGILNYEWTQTAGPFRGLWMTRYNGMTLVYCHTPGDFSLALTATDGSFTVSDTMNLTVLPESLPPKVEISLPVGSGDITAPTDIIGSVAYIDLDSWTLEWRYKNDDTWTTIAADSEAVLDGHLGVIDPTSMLNGMYEIRLRAVDLIGFTYSDQIDVIVKGALKVGNFTVSFVDLDVPVAGLPIQVVRTYDSRDKKTRDFGAGWNLDIRHARLQESGQAGSGWRGIIRGSFIPMYCVEPTRPHIVTVTASDGSVHEFDITPYPRYQAAPPSTVEMIFAPRPGTYSTLTPLEFPHALVSGTFTWSGSPLTLLNQSTAQTFDPSRYELTLHDGRRLQIDEITGLEQLIDRNDNTLTVSDNGIVHSSGKSISFLRDAEGRITQITDPAGNTIDYTYDANGDLVSVTDQENYTTTFTYGADHYLTDITDPRGITPARNEYDENGRLTAMIDADGNRIELTHHIGARQEVVQDRLGRITVYEYDDQGNVISKTDAEGSVWLYKYDAYGHKLSETDPDGNTRTYTYDAQGNMLTETDPLDNTTTYTYNNNGQVLTKTDALGNVTTYTYDASGNPFTETDANGHIITYTYDAYGNCLTETDTLGYVTTKEYDADGNVTKEIDALGNETTFTYDNNGNQLTQAVTRTTPSGPVAMTWTRTYDSKGNVTSETDPDGFTTTTEYNAIGKKSADVDKLGRRTEYTYDDRGNQTTTTYPDGTTETAAFDANGNRISTTDRAGRTTTYEYVENIDRIDKITFPTGGFINTDTDETGSFVSVTDDKGNTTTYEYDSDGNLACTVNAIGDTTKYAYDAAGRQIGMTDANGNTTHYVYDAAGRKIKTVLADGSYITVEYDLNGNKTKETDQAENFTQFEYDAAGRLTKVIDALLNETTYTYDEVGNKTSQTDANGYTTQWEYDNAGRVTKRILPLGQEETFTYDAEDNMLSHTDFNGNTTTFGYDLSNRITGKTFQDMSEETFAYTATGRQDTITDARGLTLHTYDSGDRLTQVTNPDGSSIKYAYDSMGNRTKVIVGTDTTEYAYDNLNRLSKVTDSDGGVTTYAYDAAGNRKSVSYPNGTFAKYTYDARNCLIELVNTKSSGDTISCYTYTLGPAGNRTSVKELSGRNVVYVYDATYKLLEENIDDPVFGLRDISYSYDAVGNRLMKVDNGDTTLYAYDINDRLLSENEITYSYDDNGNTLAKFTSTDTTAYAYDYQNRLVHVDNGSSAIAYKYDTDGMRVEKSVDSNVTKFLLDKNRDYAQVLEERNQADSLLVKYVFGDDLISQKRDSLTFFYHTDGQLSTRQLTDVSQNITDTYTYDAFGLLLNQTGGTENNFLYTGEQYDPNVGFYYLRARYYNQNNGRFMTMDTWPGSMFEPASLHKYLYCEGNPVNHLDPSGKAILVEMVLAITLVGIIATIVTEVFISEKVRTTMASPEFAMTRAELEMILKCYSSFVTTAKLNAIINAIKAVGWIGALATVVVIREDARENGVHPEHVIQLAIVGIGLLSTEAGIYATAVYFEVSYLLKAMVASLEYLEREYVKDCIRIP